MFDLRKKIGANSIKFTNFNLLKKVNSKIELNSKKEIAMKMV